LNAASPLKGAKGDAAERGDIVYQVDDYRAACRRILRVPDLTDDARAEALSRLYHRAKAEGEPLVMLALVEELHHDTRRDDLEDAIGYFRQLDPQIRAHRELRARGLVTCPTCRTPLSSSVDWNAWAAERAGIEADYAAREGAVP
jgi:hypothetical protein